jgi:hypothetical protein
MASARLTDIPGRAVPDAGPLRAVDSHLSAEPEQAGSALGVTLTVANHGEETAAIQNPYETVQWQLLDERGAPIPMPLRPPNLLLVPRDRPASWTAENPVRVAAVRFEGDTVDTAALDARNLELPPGTHWAADFEIDRVGRYSVGCVLTLIDAEDPQRSRILRGDPIAVRLDPA